MAENQYHEIPITDGNFLKESLSMMEIDEPGGIRAAIGKIRGDETIHIRAYQFDVEKWSLADAEKWVRDHQKKSGIERRSYDSLIGYSKEEHNMIRLRGLAIPYDRLSDNPIPGMPKMKERILPGAFTRSLASGRDVMMLWNHELKYIFGRTSRGTLKLTEEHDGVHFENAPPDSGWSKDLLPSIKRGDYSNMSFGFTEDVRPQLTLENGEYVRNVSQATLHEISLVPYAVYETTSVGMRSADRIIIDGLVLPDPGIEQKRAMDDLERFREIEKQFEAMKEKWSK